MRRYLKIECISKEVIYIPMNDIKYYRSFGNEIRIHFKNGDEISFHMKRELLEKVLRGEEVSQGIGE